MRPKRSYGRSQGINLTRLPYYGQSRKTGAETGLRKRGPRCFSSLASWLTVAAMLLLMAPGAKSQCSIVYSGLEGPVSIAQSNTGNLLVSESGSPTPNTGRISLVKNGQQRTLLSGLPSGINDQGGVSGPAGLFIRGRTLYVAISAGDAAVAGTPPGSIVANPAPSSPIFSSVLAVHLSRREGDLATGFMLTFADQQTLADGRKVILFNGGGDKMTVELVADFPNFLPGVNPTIAHSNPFALVAVNDQLYVTDGGENKIWRIDLSTGSFHTLTEFPDVSNPDAVPTGITYSQGRLLVTLFRGFPFAPGTSVVERIDPVTGSHHEFITGLTTAIDVATARGLRNTDYLVLQHSSVGGPSFGGPGLVLGFDSPHASGAILANCLTLPTAMALDQDGDALYVTELGGNLVAIRVRP